MEIYCGALSYDIKDSELRALFSRFGTVEQVSIPFDKETLRGRGFAFVRMENEAEAEAAVAGLNGYEFGGRLLRVNKSLSNRGPGGAGHSNFKKS